MRGGSEGSVGGGGGGGSGRRFSHRASVAATFTLHREPPPPPPPPPEISDTQKQLLIDSWKQLEEDVASVGVITFIR